MLKSSSLSLDAHKPQLWQGLSQLHKLRDLTLFNNRIEEVRGLSHLTELEVCHMFCSDGCRDASGSDGYSVLWESTPDLADPHICAVYS